MRLKTLASFAFVIMFGGATSAAGETTPSSTNAPANRADPSPVGEWLVNDRTARIRIENCGGALWGIVSWEKSPGGLDVHNPDPAKRARATLGLPIILDMRPSQAGRYDGEVYNADNGKIYTAHISMVNRDTLRIEGCVLGFLCGGENWMRFEPRSSSQAARTAPALDVCSAAADGKGRSK
ncbi:MAG: DUF2147 domain-containing protein [Hyphomicrobiales bacterium]|nr:DUF2147 domain-containing protein [Hyphomicrobiales bacterium]